MTARAGRRLAVASSRWWRAYNEALDDPKVQQLPAEDFRGWFNLLCLASRNEGRLPAFPDIAFALRCTEIAARSLVDRLRIAGLFDVAKGGANGSYIAPHGWQKRQYISDTSTERVKRFRKRSENVTETPPETESETEVIKDKPLLQARKRAEPVSRPDDVPDELWNDFEKLRKAKRAPLGETALAKIRLEASLAGWTLSEALTECCNRGWQGFKAEWVDGGRKNGNDRNGSGAGSQGGDGFTRALRRASAKLGADKHG